MKREFTRRLPIVGKWVRKLELLEGKYAKLKEQRDDLKGELTLVKAQLEDLKRQGDEHRARLHKTKYQLPVPPENLRLRVHGTSDEVTFLSHGAQLASGIQQLLAAHGLRFDSFTRILDFGCGCGRVLRFFEDRPSSCKLFGTDIDSEAIQWCNGNLASLATFATNRDQPPLGYENNYFDFIYSISVFTHLPEALQFLWLEELRRISKPSAVLLLTVHGERLFRKAPKASRPELNRVGFCHVKCGSTSGLPDYYQTTFHSHDYIRRRWSTFFNIKTIAPLGDQDAVLLFVP
jgi:SAM-dependent methyltransferase